MVPHAVREPASAHGADPAREVGERVQQLLERRHAQRALPTFGDDADAAVLDALARVHSADLPLAAARLADSGARLGRDVYARRCFEDSIPGALAILSTTFLASGWGTIALDGWFHRSATARFVPTPEAGRAAAPLAPFLEGVLEGYLGAAFNCRASAKAADGLRFDVRLHEGRNVNEEARR